MKSSKSRRRILDLVDLRSDPHNANRGTDRGRAALARSLRDYGAGRAVLIDRHGTIIAGNKTVEQAKRLNIPLRVVKTDGEHLIAVQRDDLDLATDPRAQALAIADNRVGELDLEWDVDMLKQLQADGLDLSAFWTDDEFATLFAEPNDRPDRRERGRRARTHRHRSAASCSSSVAIDSCAATRRPPATSRGCSTAPRRCS